MVEHKYNVGIECFKMGMYLHALTHDLSKFLPSEFFGYARHFQGPGDKDGMSLAWCYHQHRNKHHWDYWVKSDGETVPMPIKYLKQLIADWRGMGRKFNDTAEEYYVKNKERIILHEQSRYELETRLNILTG
ncbi:MAG: hypothetical protein KJ607_01695, partial [Bacteroidetes bacterium]|nr:hypothetical protein [Bacteroidota bacterium]